MVAVKGEHRERRAAAGSQDGGTAKTEMHVAPVEDREGVGAASARQVGRPTKGGRATKREPHAREAGAGM